MSGNNKGREGSVKVGPVYEETEWSTKVIQANWSVTVRRQPQAGSAAGRYKVRTVAEPVLVTIQLQRACAGHP